MNMTVQATIWRGLAQEAATAAAQMNDAQLRLTMLSIAASYKAMAKHAEGMVGQATEAESQSPGADGSHRSSV